MAYCDNTETERMKLERTDGIESLARNNSIEINLDIWKKMLAGENKDYCVWIKIDMQCKNKCMRDPVIYRHCDTPH